MDQQDYQNYKDYVEQIDLQRYWLVLKRRWLPASAVTVLMVAGAAYVAFDEEDAYEASGKVLIKGRDPAATLTGVAPELATQEGISIRNDIDQVSVLATQQELMRSTEILSEVVDALDLKNAEGAPINPGSLRRGLSTAPVPDTSVVQVSYESGNPEKAAAVVNALMDAYVERNIQNNRTEARAAREFIEDELPRIQESVDQAAEALRIFRIRNNIVNLQQESVATVELLRALEGSISDARANLAAFTAQVGSYQEQLNLSGQAAQQLARLSTAQSIRQVLEDLGQVQTEIATQGASYTENHPIMANLRRQQDSLLSLLNERVETVIGQTYSDDVGAYEFSPVDLEVTAELVEAEAQRRALERTVEELERRRQDYLTRSEVLPTLQRQESQLLNNLEAVQEEYDLLLTRLQEVRLAENQTVGTAQIQEHATIPNDPISNRSKQMKLLLAGIAGGILTGVAIAFLLDLLDKSVKTAKDAEALLGYTLLGLIPKFSTPADVAIQRNALTPERGVSPRIVTLTGTQPLISASYQMLQANLKFIRSDDNPLRLVVISSSVGQEGKSEVCANLAVSMAQVGRRVLLLDADMRSPAQHHLWNVLNRVGLSHILVGEGTLEEALQPIADNVTLLSAGVVPPNPLALVDSERMAALMKQLSAQYDYVIMDSPPLIGAADAAILGRMADGVLMIARPRQVDSSSALAAKALLSRAGADVVGFVANGVDVKNEHDDYVSMTRTKFDLHSDTAPSLPAQPSGKRKDSVSIP